MYLLTMTSAVQQILCHEYAHCMFDRTMIERWRTTPEFQGIQSEISLVCEAQRRAGHPGMPEWLALAASPECWAARTSRAVAESFFDIRALHMMIKADRLPAHDPDMVIGYFGVLFDITAKNIAIMAMRDAMGQAMQGNMSMFATMQEALSEVQQRCIILHCALVRHFLHQFRDADARRFSDRFNSTITQIQTLAQFFMMDLENNLPTLSHEGEDQAAYAERGWAMLIEAIRAPSVL